MQITLKRILAIATFTGLLSSSALAVSVPSGTELDPKQILHFANSDEPTSLDLHKSDTTVEALLFYNLFESLIIEDSDGKLTPGAAEKWEHNNDYTIWTFHLRKNAKWSNGEPVTAKDFVYAWQRLADPSTASPAAHTILQANIINAKEIVNGQKPPTSLGVKALDDYTFEVTLKSPVPYFDRIASVHHLAPLYKPTIDKYGIKWTLPENMVVNGAFMLKTWLPKEKIILAPNPYYWDKDQVILRQIEVFPIENETTAYNLYRAGDVDMSIPLPLALHEKDAPYFEKTGELHMIRGACTHYIYINNAAPKLQDVRVRTALKLAVDREIIAHKVVKPPQDPSYSFSPDRLIGFHPPKPEWFKLTQAERNAKAKQLLTEAGYSEKNPLSLTLSYNTNDVLKEIMVGIVASYNKSLGKFIKITLANEEWKTYLQKLNTGHYELARYGACARLNDASDFLIDMLASNPTNRTGYKNYEIDKLLQASLNSKTEEERNEFYYKIEAILDRDSVFIPLYYWVGARLIKPYVKGFYGDNPIRTYRFKDYYIIKH